MQDRPNVFRIDLGAVARCTREIRDLIGPEHPFIATLKADAYGHGALPVARTVLAHGADALAMTSLRDAVALREAGIEAPILTYAGVLADAASVALHERHALIPSLHDEASFAAFSLSLRRRLRVAVKVDVGPERIGVPLSRARDFIRRVHAHPRMDLFVVHAHPNAEEGEAGKACLSWQFDRFSRLRQSLEQKGIHVPWYAFAGSKALRTAGRSMALTAVDPGAALYSSCASNGCHAFAQLRTRLIAVRQVERDEHLDQVPFAMRPGMRIGIVPIGRADGMHQLHAGCVLVRHARVPILGAPALEYTRIDLGEVPEADVGDEVVIIGRQGEAAISPDEACAFQGAARVIDLALRVGPAVEREYAGP